MVEKNIRTNFIGESDNILIAYFSHSGNTRKIARQIYEQIGGDIFEIKPIIDYPDNYNNVVAQAKKEIQAGVKPLLKNKVSNVNSYEVIFIGFPNWWNTFPSPVLTFLTESDFLGKIIIPFCTHGGGGTGRSFNDISRQCPKANILNGFSINGYSVNDKNFELTGWLNTIKAVLNEKHLCPTNTNKPIQ